MENGLSTYVALLRGINVGGRSLIRMEDLRNALTASGFRDVRTVLASGNVLFRAPEGDAATLTENIERILSRALGRDVVVIVRRLDDLRELPGRFKGVENEPGVRLFVTFLPESAGTPFLVEEEGYRVLCATNGMICILLYGTGAAELMGVIEKKFGQKATTRSWNTIARLLK